MKTSLGVLVFVLCAGTAFAGPASTMGGREMPVGTFHQIGMGWPGAFYEYWHSGIPDWAIGAELVYGDWSGDFSDMAIGGAINVPFRWHLSKVGAADLAFQVKPGILLGNLEGGRDDPFVFGLRSELSLPVSVELTPKVNLITGGTIPFSIFFVEGRDDYVVVPFLARLGAEVQAGESITPWLLFEMGPAFAFGGSDNDTGFAFRVWVGTAFR